MTPSEALSWGRALKKVVSTKHKATILRVAHHDVYTKERVTRYGLGNDQTCSEIEDLRLFYDSFKKRDQHVVYSLPSNAGNLWSPEL